MDDYVKRLTFGPPFEFNEDKRYEFCRLVSFDKWPKSSPVYPLKLAQAGFYYTGKSDEVICYWCGGRKHSWKEGDKPLTVHMQLNPSCDFLSASGTENIPIYHMAQEEVADVLRQLHSNDIENPTGSTTPGSQLVSPDTLNSNVADCRPIASTGTAVIFPGVINTSQKVPAASSDSSKLAGVFPNAGSTVIGTARSSVKTPAKPDRLNRSGEDIPPPTGESLGPLRFERNRLETFKDWPSTSKVKPADLARCGFCYTKSGDRCKCIFCKGILRNWEEGDRPHIEHRKHFPRCSLVLGLNVGNVPLPIEQHPQKSNKRLYVNDDSLVNMEALGINTERPKHAQYAIETQRLASFRNWPTYKHQTPKQLAEAGFFYAGFGDNVKCFFCNGGLRNWDPADDPWQEHAKWFPQCSYVKQNKGEDFVSTVKVEGSMDVPILQQLTPVAPNAARVLPGSQFISTSDAGSMGNRVEEREVRARMDSPHVRAVEATGISLEFIMDTLRERLQATGDDFPSAASLLEAVFGRQDELARRQDELARGQSNVSDMSGGGSDTDLQVADVSSDLEPEMEDDELTPFDITVTPPPPGNETAGSDMTKSSSSNDLKEEAPGQMKKSSSMPEASKLLQENLELKEQRLCKICMVADASIVFLPCGHLVSCASCAPAMVNCPICRTVIKGTVRTFIS